MRHGHALDRRDGLKHGLEPDVWGSLDHDPQRYARKRHMWRWAGEDRLVDPAPDAVAGASGSSIRKYISSQPAETIRESGRA